MCKYCDEFEAELRNNTRFSTHRVNLSIFPMEDDKTDSHLPAMHASKEETPEIAIDDLSEPARDIVGSIRLNAKLGQAQSITESSITLMCALMGVPVREIDSVNGHARKIKADAPKSPTEVTKALFNNIMK